MTDHITTKHGKFSVKQRVTLSWDSERLGKIVTLGIEVSEVRFDNGTSLFIPNGQLREVRE